MVIGADFKSNGDNNTPAALLLAEAVETVEVEGHFDTSSQTWSNRSYACASAKKHNEAM